MPLTLFRRLAAVALLLAAIPMVRAGEIASPNTLMFYTGRISSQATWHDVLLKPWRDDYADTYIAAVSFMHAYAERFDGALRLEYELNATYNFGGQNHWEANVAPLTLRWQRFPWNDRVRTTVAFGLGFSYALEYPTVEYELENDTQQFLLFWQLEITAGPREGPWSAVLRLHHRSPGWGVMGVADGGMNAPSLGFRYQF